jgi:hypothetical protein
LEFLHYEAIGQVLISESFHHAGDSEKGKLFAVKKGRPYVSLLILEKTEF